MPAEVDPVFHDNMAFQLSNGRGISVDFQDPKWSARYLKLNDDQSEKDNYDWIFVQTDTGPTTVRSPAYPIVLSVVYRCFGWHWGAARITGFLLVGFGLALLVTWSWFEYGPLAASLTTGTLILDYAVMQSAGKLGTEVLAIFLVSVFVLTAIRAVRNPTLSNWAIAAFALSCLLMTRGNWSLAFVLFVVSCSALLLPKVRNILLPIKPVHLVCFVLCTLLLALPYWIRNCIHTEHFQPFGTAGSNGLVGAYCDESLANYGNWQVDKYRENQIEVRSKLDESKLTLAQREYLTGEASAAKAMEWARQNWTQLPLLMLYRIISHWGLTNPEVPSLAQAANAWVVVFGLLGCWWMRGATRTVVLTILIFDTIVVMLTWEHLGRYGIPLRPLIHLGYGILFSWIINQVAARLKNTRPQSS